MHKGAHVEHVKASRCSEQRLELLIGWDPGCSDITPDAEGGPYPLASAQHLACHEMDRDELWPHGIQN
jgi:hypothetical protein